MAPRPAPRPRHLFGPYVVFVGALLLWTAPGHLRFPDEEIVFQTTESLARRGSLAIEGIPKRTGEPKGRPAGTFGWAPGTDGRRYGFFGHGLSLVALPAYFAGVAAARVLGPAASHLPRSDHYVFHRRGHQADLTRLSASLTNVAVTALLGWTSAALFAACGAGWAAACGASLLVIFGTVLWAYAGTFLSEPLSALCLVTGAHAAVRMHAARDDRSQTRWAALSALAVGASVHVHVLNLVAVPCFLAYAWLGGPRPLGRRAALVAHLLGAALLALVGLDHSLRFGDPFETGRYGHYSHFTWPWPAAVAFVAAPGRSVFLFAPALTVGLLGIRRALRRARGPMWLALAVLATRWAFVSCRSDWWGGWSYGPRYLVPAFPLLGLPLAFLLERLGTLRRPVRRAVVVALFVSVLLSASLALFSPFEHMHALLVRDAPGPPSYLDRSHWAPAASPYVNVWTLSHVDVLPLGALRLWRAGHPGPAIVLGAVAVLGLGALFVLVARLRRLAHGERGEHPARHGDAC